MKADEYLVRTDLLPVLRKIARYYRYLYELNWETRAEKVLRTSLSAWASAQKPRLADATLSTLMEADNEFSSACMKRFGRAPGTPQTGRREDRPQPQRVHADRPVDAGELKAEGS
jgi:hypothetical protein